MREENRKILSPLPLFLTILANYEVSRKDQPLMLVSPLLISYTQDRSKIT